MAQDSRSRNNRKTITKTTQERRRVPSVTRDRSVYTGHGKVYDYNSHDRLGWIPGANKEYINDNVGMNLSDGQSFTLDNGNKATVKSRGAEGQITINETVREGSYKSYTNRSESMAAKDQRELSKSDKSKKGEKTQRKKDARSALRIKLDADPSAGRLKNQSGGKGKKKNVDVQGGGGSGLNIPR